uniref:Activin_recp domain-containing protein n=1 Tax=Steinernema glaseri TaxID=37863 RepID=A0A1I7Y845_9BILA
MRIALLLITIHLLTLSVRAQMLCFSTNATTSRETVASCISGWCIKANYNGTVVKMCDEGANTIDCWAYGNTCRERELNNVKATYCCCDGNLCNHAFSSFREGSLIVMLISLLSSRYT